MGGGRKVRSLAMPFARSRPWAGLWARVAGVALDYSHLVCPPPPPPRLRFRFSLCIATALHATPPHANTQYLYPSDVHSPAGGWWNAAPKGWQRNRAFAFAAVGIMAFGIFNISRMKEVRRRRCGPRLAPILMRGVTPPPLAHPHRHSPPVSIALHSAVPAAGSD